MGEEVEEEEEEEVETLAARAAGCCVSSSLVFSLTLLSPSFTSANQIISELPALYFTYDLITNQQFTSRFSIHEGDVDADEKADVGRFLIRIPVLTCPYGEHHWELCGNKNIIRTRSTLRTLGLSA